MIGLMTYNLGTTGEKHIDEIVETIKSESPDILVLNEVGWIKMKPFILSNLMKELDLPYARNTEYSLSGNHTALFSRFPLKNTVEFSSFANAGIIAVAETSIGEISIGGVHLAPNTEDTRLSEIVQIVSQQKDYSHKVILGDLNSVSLGSIVKSKNLSGLPGEPCRYEVTEYLKKSGYADTAAVTNNQHIYTVSRTQDKDVIYFKLRLDYIYLSHQLKERIIGYKVIKNKTTKMCSDHYPIIAKIR
jgi:exodeoxyribonuclease III